MIRVLIADDELQARKRLHRLLGGMENVAIAGEARNGAEVLEFLSENQVDVVLLDVRMPQLDGTEAMALWPEDGPQIIFTTAHAEHALEAFDGGAVDYVLKPVDPARLRTALERALERRRSAPKTPPQRISLSTPSGLVLLRPAEVIAVRLDGVSTSVSTDRGSFFTDSSLADLESRFAGALRRVHRQALVNLDRVLRLQDNGSGGYTAHTDDGSSVPVSRRYARELRRELEGEREA